MEPTKTFLSWSSNPSHKGWTSFAAREGAEQHQFSLPEEHRAGITTGDAPAGTSMINEVFYGGERLQNLVIPMHDLRLQFPSETGSPRAEALSYFGERIWDDLAKPIA